MLAYNLTQAVRLRCVHAMRAFRLFSLCLTVRKRNRRGPDLQNILGQSYDHLMIMPKLRPTYDGRLIYQTSYEGRTVFIRYDSLAKW